jgi:tetratricopeptide (TPR) repeat protein
MFGSFDGSAEGRQEETNLLAVIEQRAVQTKKARSEILDLLADIYLSRGLLEKSLEAALESDRIKQNSGQTLFLFTEKLWNGYLDNQDEVRRQYYELCLRALAAYVERYSRTLLAPKAAYRRAFLFADAARGMVLPSPGLDPADPLGAAVNELDGMIARYPDSVEAAEAALVKGDLLFEVGRRPRAALAVYNEGLRMSSQITSAFVEKIGRMYLVLEEYDSARRHFDKFIRSSNNRRRQAGIYYLGVLMSFTGELETARDTLTSLARIDPSSPYTNDAIELAWVIEEGRKDNEKALGYYIEAIKAEMARDTSRVVNNLERIVAEGAGSSLRPRALYRLGGVYAQQEQYDRALDRLQQFTGEYSDHDMRPDVHRALGRVYEYGLGQVDLALKEYQTILIKYPSYIFIDEIRIDITRLEPGER